MSSSRTPSRTVDKALWLAGALFTVQGFGSAITEAHWGTSFGVAGILRAVGVPDWADLVLGTAGAVFLLIAAYRAVRR
ncbi:hypothetical protein SAMN05421505_15019 [Sinosporangium album]|uniref:Uncharacterized protein n=1 Tax=Sinosporangium album TaxID=504805 RepID=A0A1G8KFD7_9ACTN|nr:hypothetical protein [Sinosporangium album]SDI42129.1 hypothetical protein SAMN05421505_15019 [Sinosporangium album]